VDIKFPQFNFKARVDKKGSGLDLTGHKKTLQFFHPGNAKIQ
jgi:hypothetical protein